ncbi:DUF7019 family protein [Amycolatopsis taiwanensis]|uniref:Uncharacterized protein n=1 Tax=Amycolatopsis taiwanensis TaxID=342230 RepID=A0A9W6VKA4_9PSEU|nr:SAVMC3_10250 family protein [Amycolatopsis taiwanensis]GLY70252.1 hypothetical protein Atai01_68710 [Amycolatopsis taiwanensis]
MWRKRGQPSLRFYLYISDTKLDMIFDQIDPSIRRRVSAEAKVDLKVASLALRQPDPAPATRIAKLRMIERYLDRHHQVGKSVNTGNLYFRGVMPLQWGWLGQGYDPDSPTDGYDMVFFRGRKAGETVMLAGSRHHVLGEQPAPGNKRLSAHSATPNILAVVGEQISRRPEIGERIRSVRESKDTHSEEGFAINATSPQNGLQAAADLRLHGPAQLMEFLAVPLVEGKVDVTVDDDNRSKQSVHAVLATPIYVALAEQKLLGGNQIDQRKGFLPAARRSVSVTVSADGSVADFTAEPSLVRSVSVECLYCSNYLVYIWTEVDVANSPPTVMTAGYPGVDAWIDLVNCEINGDPETNPGRAPFGMLVNVETADSTNGKPMKGAFRIDIKFG